MRKQPDRREWALRLSQVQQVTALAVAFCVGRSRVHTVELHIKGVDLVQSQSVKRHAALIELKNAVNADGAFIEAKLRVYYEGDAPQLAGLAWETVDAPESAIFLCIPADPLHLNLLSQLSDSDLDLRALTAMALLFIEKESTPTELVSSAAMFLMEHQELAQDVFRLRRKALRNDCRMREYFYHLDSASSPPEVPLQLGAALNFVNNKLAHRVHIRAILGKQKLVPIWPKNSRFLRRLIPTSAFMQTLITANLIDGTDSSLLDWAYQKFAEERLGALPSTPEVEAVLLTHGVPNGDAFFRIAELAIACIEHEVDAPFWAQHLHTFARTAHVYAEQAAELDDAGDYFYAFREGRHYPKKRATRVAKAYQPILPHSTDVERLIDLFSSLMGQALPDKGQTPLLTRPLKAEAEFFPQSLHKDFFDLLLQLIIGDTWAYYS